MLTLGHITAGSAPTNHRHKIWKMLETSSGWGSDFALSCVNAFYGSDQLDVLTQEIIFADTVQQNPNTHKTDISKMRKAARDLQK